MAATRRRGAALEAAILEAAWAQLVEQGYGGFSVEAVADRAGTGKAVLYRRWPGREALLLATIGHRFLDERPDVPDTGSLREDVLTWLRGANRFGDSAPALFSTFLGAYFDETETTPAQLRAQLLGDRSFALTEIVERAVARGELAAVPPPRVMALPFDLVRHEFLMNLSQVPDETIVDIVDTVFLPLARLARPADTGGD